MEAQTRAMFQYDTTRPIQLLRSLHSPSSIQRLDATVSGGGSPTLRLPWRLPLNEAHAAMDTIGVPQNASGGGGSSQRSYYTI